MSRIGWWRPCLLLTGALILAGGPRHPRGSMAEMLAHPDWVPSHLLLLTGFLAMLAGLVLYRRGAALPARTARWTRWAIYGTAVQAVEMAVHTAAVVDSHHLMAGEPTPVLTVHLGMSLIAYPLFGLTTIGWIVATARDRALASRWIAWLGILGAAAHGLATPLVVGLSLSPARILFPMLMLLAAWCVLAALWPLRAASPAGLAAAASGA